MISTRLLPIEEETSLVTFQLIVAGSPVPGMVPVRSIEVIEEVNRIPTAIIHIADGNAAAGEWEISSGDHFPIGEEIEILLGYHNENRPVFKGLITKQCLRAHNRTLNLEIECKHRATRLTGSRRSRQFLDSTDADAVQAILKEYDLAATSTSTDVVHDQIVQYDATDWDFIINRLEANGALLHATPDGVHTLRPEVANEAIATLKFGANLLEFDLEIDAHHQYGTWVMQAWNPANQALTEATAVDPGWSTVGNFDPESLAAATGRGSATLRHSGALSTDELQAWADNALLRSRLAFVTGRIQTKGVATVGVAKTVALAGLGDRFNGLAWVSGVRHEMSGGSWTTDIQIGLNPETHGDQFAVSLPGGAGLLPPVQGLHTGIVTALENDPAGESRVQVAVPSVSAEEDGVWCRIATLDAGNGRGTFFRPEIGDEVVISFLNNDPRQGVVLGMLHSSANATPFESLNDNHIKGYVSRSDIRIEIDDDKKILALSTPAGKSVTLDEDQGLLQIADENGNSLELSSSGISLVSAGDFEITAGGNLKLEGSINLEAKAGAQYKVEGTAGAEMKSSGITVIKGSLVQIN